MALASLEAPSIDGGKPATKKAAPANTRESLYLGLLKLGDIVLIVLISLLFYEIYYGTGKLSDRFPLAALLSAVVSVNLLHALDAYARDTMTGLGNQLSRCFAGAALTSALIGIVFGTFAGLPLEWLGLGFAAQFTATSFLHGLTCRTFAYWRKTGQLGKAVAIFGTPGLAERVAEHLKADAAKGGIRHMWVWTFDPSDAGPGGVNTEPSGLTELMALGRSEQLDEIILAIPLETAARISSWLRRLAELPVDIALCPGLLDLRLPLGPTVDKGGIGTIPMLKQPSPLKGWNHVLKRGMDVLGGGFLLLLLSPLLLLTALLIKLESPGPVFFRQRRYGFNSHPFMVYKFRTMRHDGGRDLAQQARRNDPRITRIGGFLRKWSIDELPQIFNVLKGEMSLVGPRPHADWTDEHFCELIDCYFARLRVKPGITGWAQAHGLRGETETVEKMRMRVAYDLAYIDRWSLLLDFRILIMTIGIILNRRNAF